MTDTQKRTLKKLNEIYTAIGDGLLKVSNWEYDFINSVNGQNEKRELSWKQAKKLNEIWERIQ